MKSWTKPTPAQVERAVARLTNEQSIRYFFKRLQNPLWLEPLYQKGWFDSTPQVIRHENETVSFPQWPQGEFLTRIAAHSETQNLTLKILLRVETENPAVKESIIDAALILPPGMAAQVGRKAKRWGQSPLSFFLPAKLASLIRHLATAGETDTAFRLARELFFVRRKSEKEGERRTFPKAEPRFDPREYRELVSSTAVVLASADDARALKLMCDLLERAMEASERLSGNEPEDFSYIWRPRVDQPPPYASDEVRDALVSAVRSVAEHLDPQEPAAIARAVKALMARRWRIFHRIGLHVQRRYANSCTRTIRHTLTDRSLFDAYGVRQEYFALQRDCFNLLNRKEHRTVLSWINSGPKTEAAKSPSGEEPSVEAAAAFKERWMRDHLAPLRDHLDQTWKAHTEQLLSKHGEPKDPADLHETEPTNTSVESPFPLDDLKDAQPEEILSILRSWNPPEPHGSTRDGLARCLTSLVVADPSLFTDRSREFEGLDPTYIRAIVEAFTKLAQKGSAFDWEKVLKLSAWVVSQPREIKGRTGAVFDQDPDWGWTRDNIVQLLRAGFAGNDAEVPIEHRCTAWRVLEELCKDPDPSPERESNDGDPVASSTYLSINSTRGNAIHTLIQYAFWVRRDTVSKEKASPVGLQDIPEVKAQYERSLTDPTHAIRSIYGQCYPWLQMLDKDWASSLCPRIFERDGGSLGQAAWEAFVTQGRQFGNVLPSMRPEYARAIENLGSLATERKHPADSEERLAEHLMMHYWWGTIAIDDPLLRQFFLHASIELRTHAIEFVGRSLTNAKEDIDDAILTRLRELWTLRVDTVKAHPDATATKELCPFGWWLHSEKFDDEWALDETLLTLELAKDVDPDLYVVQKAAKFAMDYPTKAVRILERVVEADTKGWGILGWKSNAHMLLSRAIASGDTTAKEEAEHLVHKLGKRGFMEFGSLLN